MKTNIYIDFQICISVPVNKKRQMTIIRIMTIIHRYLIVRWCENFIITVSKCYLIMRYWNKITCYGHINYRNFFRKHVFDYSHLKKFANFFLCSLDLILWDEHPVNVRREPYIIFFKKKILNLNFLTVSACDYLCWV